MKTQSKFRVLIGLKGHDLYLNRMGDGVTKSHDAAIRFHDIAEASEWLLNSRYAPENKEDYEYVNIKITSEVVEDVP